MQGFDLISKQLGEKLRPVPVLQRINHLQHCVFPLKYSVCMALSSVFPAQYKKPGFNLISGWLFHITPIKPRVHFVL